MKWLRFLPNTLTLINLFLGTMAVVAMANALISTALILMAICLVADIFDGMLARKMGVAGELGIQLDSLADVVSFGVLPGMMVFYMGARFGGEFPGQQASAVLGALLTTSAGFRLARFNVDERPRNFFWGLATPAGAMLIAGWLWAQDIGKDLGLGVGDIPWLIIVIPVFVSMAFQLPVKLPGLKSPKSALIIAGSLAALTVAGIFLLGPIAITIGLMMYVVLGFMNIVFKWY